MFKQIIFVCFLNWLFTCFFVWFFTWLLFCLSDFWLYCLFVCLIFDLIAFLFVWFLALLLVCLSDFLLDCLFVCLIFGLVACLFVWFLWVGENEGGKLCEEKGEVFVAHLSHLGLGIRQQYFFHCQTEARWSFCWPAPPHPPTHQATMIFQENDSGHFNF